MTDLTGTWHGIFTYPDAFPPTRFVAVLTERHGALTGEIEEPRFDQPDGRPVGAMVEGRRDGASVSFVKYYDSDSADYDTVIYKGSASVDGREVAGYWEIPGDWSGAFIMTRETSAEVPAEAIAESGAPTSFR